MEKQLSFEDYLLQESEATIERVREAASSEAWMQADLDTDRWVRLSELLNQWQAVDHRKGAF